MEVDVGTPPSSSNGSRRTSPFRVAGGGGGGSGSIGDQAVDSMSTAFQTTRSSSSRKRRRSLHHFYLDAGAENDEGEAAGSSFIFARDASEEEGSPVKRPNVFGRKESTSAEHHFHALGQGLITTESDEGDYEASDYGGMDSPMHSLSLVSPSGSVDGRMLALQYRQSEEAEEDVDMGTDGASTQRTSRGSSAKDDERGGAGVSGPSSSSNTSFVPRQVRSRIYHRHNVPLRPSPLTQAQLSDEMSSSTDSSPRQHPMDATSVAGSPRVRHHQPLRRSATDFFSARSSNSTDEMDVVTRRASYVERDALPPSIRRASRGERAIRTPSPRPHFIPSDEETSMDDDIEYENDRGGGDGGAGASVSSTSTPGRRALRSALHPSPGVSTTASYFPSGRHMLRYTMGYRDDCELCKSKVAGHYGHVVHRSN